MYERAKFNIGNVIKISLMTDRPIKLCLWLIDTIILHHFITYKWNKEGK